MFTTLLRLAVTAWILVLLGRAALAAWRERGLTVTIWRNIGWRDVAGAIVLVIVVIAVATALIDAVPGLDLGLGSVVGFAGNAVFAPLEEVATRSGDAPETVRIWLVGGAATAFLGLLVLLLPWLAFVEEEVFRAGLEQASLAGEVRAALTFGLVHLVMLVPLGAALAIAVAGFVYGRIYRRHYERADDARLPPAVTRSLRPTRRSAAAASRARRASQAPPAGALLLGPTPRQRQAAGVLASATLHATFNTLIVILVWASILIGLVAE